MSLHPRPVVIERGAGRLEYGTSPRLRFFSACLALILALAAPRFFSDGTLRILAWFVALFLGLSALSEDRWIFERRESEEPRVRRRAGLMPLTRNWEIPPGNLVSLELRRGGPGETFSGGLDQAALMEARLLGIGRGPWVALALVLRDGRSLALSAGAASRAARLEAEGKRVAVFLGIPFTGER